MKDNRKDKKIRELRGLLISTYGKLLIANNEIDNLTNKINEFKKQFRKIKNI